MAPKHKPSRHKGTVFFERLINYKRMPRKSIFLREVEDIPYGGHRDFALITSGRYNQYKCCTQRAMKKNPLKKIHFKIVERTGQYITIRISVESNNYGNNEKNESV